MGSEIVAGETACMPSATRRLAINRSMTKNGT